MKIEAGEYYKTRDGRKVGPMKSWCLGGWHSDSSEHPLDCGVWLDDGTAKHAGAKDSPDLISEWQDEAQSPIRTVTRREIVAGVYGRLHVSRDFSMEDKNLRIALSDCLGKPDPAGHYWNLDELDEAIHTLSQIREVIAEESGK